jgi:hypothetical protein
VTAVDSNSSLSGGCTPAGQPGGVYVGMPTSYPVIERVFYHYPRGLRGALAFAAENIFADHGIQHEIGIYYHVAWPGLLAPDDLLRGGEVGHRFRWAAVPTLGSIRFEPAGLVPILQARPDTLTRVVLGQPEPY